jgi:hypothetical protein
MPPSFLPNARNVFPFSGQALGKLQKQLASRRVLIWQLAAAYALLVVPQIIAILADPGYGEHAFE